MTSPVAGPAASSVEAPAAQGSSAIDTSSDPSTASLEGWSPGPTARTAVVYFTIAVSFLAGTAAPTPLYARYAHAWGGTALDTTGAFAVYGLTVLIGLLMFGRLSAHLGRKPVLYAALVVQLAAMVVLLKAAGYVWLFGGRGLQGLGVGAAMGALSAGMITADKRRGLIASSAAPGAGTATGALVSGVVVNALPWPSHLIYLLLLTVFIAQLVLVLTVPDTTDRRPGALRSLRPTIAVPSAARGPFLAAAPVLFAAWALPGFYSSLGPALTAELSGVTAPLLGGFMLFLLAAVACTATLLLRRASAPMTMRIGLIAIALTSAGLTLTALTGSVTVFVVSTLVAGIGFGAGLQGGTRYVMPLALEHERAGLMSAVFIASYLGMGLPAVAAGALVTQGHPLLHVVVGYAAVLLALSALASAITHTLSRPRRVEPSV